MHCLVLASLLVVVCLREGVAFRLWRLQSLTTTQIHKVSHFVIAQHSNPSRFVGRRSCASQSGEEIPKDVWWSRAKSAIGAFVLSCGLVSLGTSTPSAIAADTVAVGKCLLQSCQKELAQCILNPKCLANVICLNTCNDRKDEAECQIRCGDLFENDVVGVFNSCAVSQKKCVPQKANEGLYPLPAPESLVKKFDTGMWNSGNGRWYTPLSMHAYHYADIDCI